MRCIADLTLGAAKADKLDSAAIARAAATMPSYPASYQHFRRGHRGAGLLGVFWMEGGCFECSGVAWAA